jgi:hypothetical protein
VQLRKAREADPAFRAALAALVEETKAKGGDQTIQSANITGDRNVSTDIARSGNVSGESQTCSSLPAWALRRRGRMR